MYRFIIRLIRLLYYLPMEMEMKKEKSEILYAMFVYGGIVWWWAVLLWSLIQFIIECFNYFN